VSSIRDYIQKNRTAIFDWSVITISFLLSFVFRNLSMVIESPSFTYMMLSALLFYAAGVWLKHRPLSYRVTTTGEKLREVTYALFLVCGHWVIMVVTTIFAEIAIIGLFKIKANPHSEKADPYITFGSMLVGCILTWMVFRIKKKRQVKKKYAAGYLFRRELVADIFLVWSVSILTFIFWDMGIVAMLSRNPTATFGDIWLVFIMLSICFVLFYLPLRYLYLIEDHSHNQTWKRMLLIFAIILLRSYFSLLQV